MFGLLFVPLYSVAEEELIKVNQAIYTTLTKGKKSDIKLYSYFKDWLRVDSENQKQEYWLFNGESKQTWRIFKNKKITEEYINLKKNQKPRIKGKVIIVLNKNETHLKWKKKKVREYTVFLGTEPCLIIASAKVDIKNLQLKNAFIENSVLSWLDNELSSKTTDYRCKAMLKQKLNRILNGIGMPIYWHNTSGRSAHLLDKKEEVMLPKEYFTISKKYKYIKINSDTLN